MAHGGARPGSGRRRGGANKTADRRRRIKNAATARAVAKLAISKEHVLSELAKLAFANMLDYIEIGADGQPRVDLSALTPDQAAAIHEVVVETRTEERDDGPPIVIVKAKFKLADKRAALVDIGRHLGLFKDRVEHSGPDGGPVEVKTYSDIEAARLIARLLTKVTASNNGNSRK
jgi:phage terminase small subunit